MNYTLRNDQKKIPERKHGRIEDDGWIDKALERAIAVIDNPLREVRRDSRSKKR